MQPIEFVSGIKESIIDSGIQEYRDLFNTTDRAKATDPYWIKALSLFDTLNHQQKENLFSIINLIQINTVSSFFAILDGVSVMRVGQPDFALTAIGSNQPINGDLSELFLELIEEESANNE